MEFFCQKADLIYSMGMRPDRSVGSFMKTASSSAAEVAIDTRTTFALAPATRLRASSKEKAPAKASATNYNEGEDNHGVKVISLPFYREPITFHLFISFMDKIARK